MRQYKTELSIIVILLFIWEAEFFILDILPRLEAQAKEKESELGLCPIQDTSPALYPIIFNEIAWMGTPTSSYDEWIELKNISDGPVDLTDWQIFDKAAIEEKKGAIKIISENIILDPGGFLLLERTDDSTVPDIKADVIYTGSLNDEDELLYLFDQDCSLQDEIEANPRWPAEDNDTKRTIERRQDLSWQMSENIGGTPKAPNSQGEQKEPIPDPSPPPTPEDPNNHFLPKIILNEIFPNTLGKDEEEEFIELFNAGDTTADLSNIELQDEKQDKFILEFGTTIPALSYRAFYTGKKVTLNNDGDVVSLLKGEQILDKINYSKAPKGESYNRQDDNTWAWSTTTTPGTKNEITTKDTNSTDPAENKIYPRHIWINEFFPNPEGKDAENEFIEIYNPGPAEIDLTAWQIDDQENKGSHPYTFPENFIIKRGEYITLPYSQTKISLNNNGDWVRLLWPDGQAIDEVPYSDPPEGESYNKTNNGWRWSCTTTPGEPNKIAADDECATSPEEETKNYSRSIWINEFLPNPAGRDTENEFIEIYNKGPDEIDLNGWQIDDCENKGSHPHKFPAGKIIKAGEYLSLPYSDTKIALNNDHDCVRLLWPDDTAIDEIEYENPPEAESYNKKGQGWCWSTTPTPGEQNNCSGKKPEKEEIKEYSRALWINEFLPNPKGKDEEGEFIELQNRGEEEEIDLTDWQIDDCENTGSRPHTFSENTKIQPDHYLTLYYKDTKISLNNNGDCVRLLNPAGQAVDEIKYGKAKEGQSYSRQNVDHWQWTDNPTPYKDNEFPQILAAKAEGPKTPKNQVQPNQQKILPPHQNLRCGGLPQTGPDIYIYFSPIFLFFFIPRTSPPKADGAGFPARLRLPALGGLAGGRSTKPRRKRCLPAKACGFRRWQAGHGCKPMELHFYLTKFKKYYKNRGCSFKSNLLEP